MNKGLKVTLIVIVVILIIVLIWLGIKGIKPDAEETNSANIINGIETDTGNEVDTNIVDTNNVDEANTIANETTNETSGNVTDEPEEEPENNGQSNTENNSSTSEVVPGTTASREERAVELAKEYYAEKYGSTDGVYFRYDSVNSDGRYRVVAGSAEGGSNKFLLVNLSTGEVQEK